MTRLDWSQPKPKYESGVDRGVLYPSSGAGVPWNGLVTVEEAFSGGESNSYYFDGVKFLEVTNPEDVQSYHNSILDTERVLELHRRDPGCSGFHPYKATSYSFWSVVSDYAGRNWL